MHMHVYIYKLFQEVGLRWRTCGRLADNGQLLIYYIKREYRTLIRLSITVIERSEPVLMDTNIDAIINQIINIHYKE